jgi:hypothetical protein
MARTTSFAFFFLFPLLLSAQTNPDLSRILERLDRLEQENRTLAGEVKALRAELAAARPPAAPDLDPATELPKASLEERTSSRLASTSWRRPRWKALRNFPSVSPAWRCSTPS